MEKAQGTEEQLRRLRHELKNEAVYTYWYNQMWMLQKDKSVDPELTGAVREVFAALREEAIQRRKETGWGEEKIIHLPEAAENQGEPCR